MRNDLDVCSCNMGIGIEEVGSKDTSKELGRCDRMLLCLDVYRILHRISSHDDAVVGMGIPRARQIA